MNPIKIFYNVDGNNICSDTCPIYPHIMIGSENCSKCTYFWKGGATPHHKKPWIECLKIKNEKEIK